MALSSNAGQYIPVGTKLTVQTTEHDEHKYIKTRISQAKITSINGIPIKNTRNITLNIIYDAGINAITVNTKTMFFEDKACTINAHLLDQDNITIKDQITYYTLTTINGFDLNCAKTFENN